MGPSSRLWLNQSNPALSGEFDVPQGLSGPPVDDFGL